MKKKTKVKNKKKTPHINVIIDNSLDKYNNMPIFQENLDEANKTLKRVGLPKAYKKRS